MSRTRFRVNPHYIVTGAKSEDEVNNLSLPKHKIENMRDICLRLLMKPETALPKLTKL